MTDLLVRLFVKDPDKTEEVSVRTAYSVLSSMVGILCNIVLFGVKIAMAVMLHSVSVMADAFNNLSDAGTSIIGFIGVKIAEMPADTKHPFGHGRIEYITGLIVSFLVIEVGLTFFKDSIGKIKNPPQMEFHLASIVILLFTIAVKLWLGLFNKKLGERINSSVLMATAADSAGDVITTAATVVSVIFWYFTDINIDGFVGIGVSVVVMWAGVGIAKETLKPLIGEPVTPEVYNMIKNFVEKYDGILGSHDLIVHNYGPGRSMASIHAEVPNDVSIEVSHEIVDKIERDASKELGIFLVIHMDPLETKDEKVVKTRELVEECVRQLDDKCSIHDFRMVDGEEQINLIFDFSVPRNYSQEKSDMLMMELLERLQETDKRYCCVITLENSFIEE